MIRVVFFVDEEDVFADSDVEIAIVRTQDLDFTGDAIWLRGSEEGTLVESDADILPVPEDKKLVGEVFQQIKNPRYVFEDEEYIVSEHREFVEARERRRKKRGKRITAGHYKGRRPM